MSHDYIITIHVFFVTTIIIMSVNNESKRKREKTIVLSTYKFINT